MSTEQSIQRLSRWAQLGLVITAVAVPIGVLWVWWMPGEGFAAAQGLSTAKRWLTSAASLLGIGVQWLMLWQLWRLFELYRGGTYFEAANGLYLRRLGGLLLLSIPVRVVVHALTVAIIRYPQGTLAIQLGSPEMLLLIAGLALMAIGHVMHLAAQIHAEWRHTY